MLCTTSRKKAGCKIAFAFVLRTNDIEVSYSLDLRTSRTSLRVLGLLPRRFGL